MNENQDKIILKEKIDSLFKNNSILINSSDKPLDRKKIAQFFKDYYEQNPIEPLFLFYEYPYTMKEASSLNEVERQQKFNSIAQELIKYAEQEKHL